MLTLYLNCKRVDANGRLINYMSKINLIDLVGSEDNRRTGNQAGSSTFKESTKINLSLTVLKRVVKVCLIIISLVLIMSLKGAHRRQPNRALS